MLLADDGTGHRIQASPGASGLCPSCKEPLIPKCGEIVIWHWAHWAGSDCDSWSEGESEWHLYWKNEFAPDQIEIPVGNHRADIIVGRTVIELQHSSLSPEEVREREEFYQREIGHIIWVIDLTEVEITFIEATRDDLRYRKFLWSHPRRWLTACKAPVYWDLGDGTMFRMEHLNFHGRTLLSRRLGATNGWGKIGTKDEFLSFYRDRDEVA